MVAVSANSPFLFICRLWGENSIHLFKQAFSVGRPFFRKRGTFGLSYIEESVFKCFRANLNRFPVLLPEIVDEPPERVAYLQLHNRAIWRWNRPLIGFDDTGTPHLRIEHRVMPADPTIVDVIANAAPYFGTVQSFSEELTPPRQCLPFTVSKNNFYQAAEGVLDAEIEWFDGHPFILRQVLTDDLLPPGEIGSSRTWHRRIRNKPPAGHHRRPTGNWINRGRSATGLVGLILRTGPDRPHRSLPADAKRPGCLVYQWSIY